MTMTTTTENTSDYRTPSPFKLSPFSWLFCIRHMGEETKVILLNFTDTLLCYPSLVRDRVARQS
jgi:hypothetical protein